MQPNRNSASSTVSSERRAEQGVVIFGDVLLDQGTLRYGLKMVEAEASSRQR